MLLGLDLGTTNVKALLVEGDGRIVARASSPVKIFCAGNDVVEQDIEDIFSATISAIARLGSGNDLSSVRAIGVSAQGAAMQIVDGDWKPVGRVTSWLDGRGRT